jgi:hypothetical protein
VIFNYIHQHQQLQPWNGLTTLLGKDRVKLQQQKAAPGGGWGKKEEWKHEDHKKMAVQKGTWLL